MHQVHASIPPPPHTHTHISPPPIVALSSFYIILDAGWIVRSVAFFLSFFIFSCCGIFVLWTLVVLSCKFWFLIFQRLNLDAWSHNCWKKEEKKKKGLSQEITIRSPTTRSQAEHLQPFLAHAPASVPLFQMMNRMMGPSTTSCWLASTTPTCCSSWLRLESTSTASSASPPRTTHALLPRHLSWSCQRRTRRLWVSLQVISEGWPSLVSDQNQMGTEQVWNLHYMITSPDDITWWHVVM